MVPSSHKAPAASASITCVLTLVLQGGCAVHGLPGAPHAGHRRLRRPHLCVEHLHRGAAVHTHTRGSRVPEGCGAVALPAARHAASIAHLAVLWRCSHLCTAVTHYSYLHPSLAAASRMLSVYLNESCRPKCCPVHHISTCCPSPTLLPCTLPPPPSSLPTHALLTLHSTLLLAVVLTLMHAMHSPEHK